MKTRKKEEAVSNTSTPPLEVVEDLLTDSDDEVLPTGWDMRVTDKGRVFYVRSVIYTLYVFVPIFLFFSFSLMLKLCI